MADYSDMSNPYDGIMNRIPGGISSVVADVSTTWNQPAMASSHFDPTVVGASSDAATYGGMQGTPTSTGSVETQNVNTGQSINDLWINTFIRSKNWKPGNRGFNIDGQTGNAEFNNVTVRGTIESSIIIGSTIIGLTLEGVAITGSTITGGTITGTTNIIVGDIGTANYTQIDGGADGAITRYLNGIPVMTLSGAGMAIVTSAGAAAASIYGYGTNEMAIDVGGSEQYLFNETDMEPSVDGDLALGAPGAEWLSLYSKNLRLTDPQILIGAGALSTNRAVSRISTTGANSFTLGTADEGFIKIIIMNVFVGNATITPSSMYGFSTITMNSSGDTCVLIYTSGIWAVLSNQGCTLA